MLVSVYDKQGEQLFRVEQKEPLPNTIQVPEFVEGKAYLFGQPPPLIEYRYRVFTLRRFKDTASTPARPIYVETGTC